MLSEAISKTLAGCTEQTCEFWDPPGSSHWELISSPFPSTSDVSRAADVTVSAYLRTAPGHDRQDMGNDLLLSSVTFSPNVQSKVNP